MRMLVLFAGCFAFVAGCTDDIGLGGAASGVTSSTGTGVGASTGGAGGSGGAGGQAGAGDSVTFIVVESIFGESPAPPLEGATVAFDPPGGARVEQVTGADGKATFTGIDWSRGKAAATAYLQGRPLWSSVNLDEARLAKALHIDDAVALFLFDSEAPEMVIVKGTLTGILDTAHSASVTVVNTNAGSEWIGSSTGTFTVSVPKGAPFTLQAFERDQKNTPSGQGEDMPIFQVLEQSFGSTAVDVNGVVLDFVANAVPTEAPVDISIATPTRADSPVRAGRGLGLASPSNSVWATGWNTHIDISANKSEFVASLLWREPAWATDPSTLIRVYQGPNEISSRLAMGWPTLGSIGMLPDTPAWVTPADASKTYPLHDAMEWKLFDADVPVVRLQLLTVGGLAWQIDAGPDATTLTVPQPPSPVDAATLFGGSLWGKLVPFWVNETTYVVEAYSLSQGVLFKP